MEKESLLAHEDILKNILLWELTNRGGISNSLPVASCKTAYEVGIDKTTPPILYSFDGAAKGLKMRVISVKLLG